MYKLCIYLCIFVIIYNMNIYIYLYISLSLGMLNSTSVAIRYQQLIRKVCCKDADEATSKQLNPISGGWGGGSTINHHPSMHGPGMKRP